MGAEVRIDRYAAEKSGCWFALKIAALVMVVIAFGLGWTSMGDTADLLRRLAVDPALKAEQVGELTRLELDGMQPNAAMGEFAVDGSAATIRAGLLQACRRQGLGPPDEYQRTPGEDTVCAGSWEGWHVTVELETRCAVRCRTFIDVYGM